MLWDGLEASTQIYKRGNMFKELFEADKSDHLFIPKINKEFDIWNNPGQVMSILRMKPLSVKHTKDILYDRVNNKVNIDKMVEKGYIELNDGMYSITKYGRETLSYVSGFSKTKPKR